MCDKRSHDVLLDHANSVYRIVNLRILATLISFLLEVNVMPWLLAMSKTTIY